MEWFLFFFCSVIIVLVFVGGALVTSSGTNLAFNSAVHEGDTFAMEVDLQSEIPSRRTLRFFIKDVPQPAMVNYLPKAVQFAVCKHCIYLPIFLYIFFEYSFSLDYCSKTMQ